MSAFDPNYPTGEIIAYDSDFRNQFNALHQENVATNQRIDNIQLTPGPKGDKGDQGEKGDKGDPGDPGASFPYAGNAEIDGTLLVQGELRLFDSDPNGSGEAGVRIGREAINGVWVPALASRAGGMNIFGLKWDLAGFADGMGSATIQDGAIYRVDLASGTLKPWNVTVQTAQVMGADGNPMTITYIAPPP